MKSWRTALVSVCSLMLVAGCSTNKAIDSAAASAAQQLGELQLELTSQINDHNYYLDSAADNVNEELDRHRGDDIDLFFLTHKDAYIASIRGANASKVASTLPKFAESTLREWQSRDARRMQLRSDTLAALDSGRQKITVEMKKLRKLRSQLNTLATPRSGADAFRMLAAYLKEVDKELNKLEEGSDDDG